MKEMTASKLVGAFRLDASLGKGAGGEVFRGVHLGTDVPVAVKLLTAGGGEDSSIHREVAAQAGIASPRVVHVYDFGALKEGGYYIAMELASGTVDPQKLKNWGDTERIIEEVLQGLAAAHGRGILHRDIKPANILIFDDQGVKLSDFGIAYILGEERHRSARSLTITSGTPCYLPPEQIRGLWRQFGPWSDLYALGAMVYEMVTGGIPFRAPTALAMMLKHCNEPRPLLRPLYAVPRGLEGWIHRAMAIDPRDRFQTAAEALQELPRGLTWSTEGLEDNEDLEETADARGADSVVEDTAILTLQNLPPSVETENKGLKNREVGRMNSGLTKSLQLKAPAEVQPSGVQKLATGLSLFGLRETPFVGRREERQKLWNLLHHVEKTRRPHLVLIEGASGVGKTKLMDWLRIKVHELGAAKVLRIIHSPGALTPGEGIAGMLRDYFRSWHSTPEELEALVRNRYHKRPRENERTYGQEVLALRDLLLAADGEKVSPVNSRVRIRFLERFLRRVQEEQRTVLFVDDLQWGDEFVESLRYLMEMAGLPLLMVASLRDDGVEKSSRMGLALEAIKSRGECSTFYLKALEEEDILQYIDGLLPLEEDLRNELPSHCFGSPLLARQIISAWVEEGGLIAAGEYFVPVEGFGLGNRESPYEIWTRRLRSLSRRLGAKEQEILELAAILGRECDAKEWTRLVEMLGHYSKKEIESVEESWLQAGLIQIRPKGFAFSQGMIVEALERRSREEGRFESHHLRCAEMLEELYPGYPAELGERVAEHYLSARQMEAALLPLLRWCEELALRGDPRWEENLERTEVIMNYLGISSDDPRRLEHELNRVSFEYRHDRYDQALKRALRLEEQALQSGAFLLASRTAVSIATLAQGEYPITKLEEAVKLAKRAGDRDYLGRVLGSLGLKYLWRNRLDEGIAYLTEALAVFPQDRSNVRRAFVEYHLGWVEMSCGRLQKGEEIFTGLLELARENHFVHLEATLLNSSCELERYRGRYGLARRWGLEALEQARIFELGIHEPAVLMNLALVEIGARNFVAAKTFLESAQKTPWGLTYGARVHRLMLLIELTIACGEKNWSESEKWKKRFLEAESLEYLGLSDMPWLLEQGALLSLEEGRVSEGQELLRLAIDAWKPLNAERAAILLRLAE